MEAVEPAYGGVVMGTGIVSVGLWLDHSNLLSAITLALAAAVWVALAVVLLTRVVRRPDRVRLDAGSPAALTGVAASAVLGARLELAGWHWAGIGLLVVALLAWLGLLAPVLRSWETPTVGASLMLTVSTESIGALAATIAVREHSSWLLYFALAPFVIGLAFYVFVMARFDRAHLHTGRGDHWITGGALAISTLAAAQIALGARELHEPSGLFESVAVVMWVLTIAWLPVLLATEVIRPRLSYDLRRWSTVFPVGMYAACSFVVGTVGHARAITDFARVWIWVAVAVWFVVLLGMSRHPRTS